MDFVLQPTKWLQYNKTLYQSSVFSALSKGQFFTGILYFMACSAQQVFLSVPLLLATQ